MLFMRMALLTPCLWLWWLGVLSSVWFSKNKVAFEGRSISPNVMVKYGKGWMVCCSDDDAKVQVFF